MLHMHEVTGSSPVVPTTVRHRFHGAFFVAKNSCSQRQFEKPTNIPPFRTLQKLLIDPSKTPFLHMRRKVSRAMQTLILNLWKENFPNIAKRSFLRRCSMPNHSSRQSTPPRACFSFGTYHVRNKPPLIGVMTGNDKQNESHFFSLCLMKLTKIFREICVKSSKMWRFGG